MNKKNSDLVIMKFGGSCLQDPPSFNQTTNIVEEYLTNSNVILVTSALKRITDKLIEFYNKSCEDGADCQDLIKEVKDRHLRFINETIDSQREEYSEAISYIDENINELTQLGKLVKLLRPSLDIQDIIISYGERLSTFMVSKYLESIGYTSNFISSDEIIITDDNFSRALPLLDETEILVREKINSILEKNQGEIICITGFYGSTKDKKITTLGRGGTDLTAAILAYSLKVDYKCKVIYWKDVDGFLNADPRITEKASLLQKISYIEAKELAFFGSKVLHPLCLDVNEKGNITSEIRPFNKPHTDNFTTITKEITKDQKIIKAITSIKRLSMVTIESETMISLPGTAAKLFGLLGENNINIKFISQSSSENNITFGIDLEDSMKVSFLLRNSDWFGKQWFSIKIDNDISLIAVIGAGMLQTPGIAGKVFTTLGENNINVRAIAQGSSELNITIIVERKDCVKAVNVLYDAFINGKEIEN
ncbi:MAG: aspartate kinase [Candidatus Lokiarchaeota archaeon]|nr:aspartate kinase [Candidatus Lokiarchaeota archaeon]MBD3199679.1 aspartate kinase [Candidatus Lokiarchaeota archaeon]